MKRQRNDHIRKVCACSRRSWSKCPHPWHFNFRHRGTSYRFSLDREFPNRRISTKIEAEAARDELCSAIRNGTFKKRGTSDSLNAGPARALLTLRQLFDRHEERHVMRQRPASAKRWRLQVKAICRRTLKLPTGEARAFGEWAATDVTIDAIEQFQDLRQPDGIYAVNRDLQVLRAVFNWGVGRGLLDSTPFRRGEVSTIARATERRRDRRLHSGELERLLAACPQPAKPSREPHPIFALIVAAIETGARRGELLTLQWSQVRLDGPRPALVLTAAKTKTKTQREVPISPRLRAVLEMRRNGADGEPHPSTAYVFGTSTGEPIGSFKRAWQSVRLRAHDFTPVQVKGTGRLTPANQAQLAKIDLHWHDLRREAGSRWLDAGVPLHTIQRWLGHTNISQTSTYLAVTDTGSHEAMARFHEQRGTTEVDLQIANRCTKAQDETLQDDTPEKKTPHEIRGSVN